MPRTDAELLELLQNRFQQVNKQVARSCEKVGRDPKGVQLVAVTKSVSARVIRLVQQLGYIKFGENRPQTLWAKAEELPGVEWHFIGHLQRNKIDRTVPLLTLFHSVDSARLLQSLAEFARKQLLSPRILLEFNCSREEAKGGFAPQELPAMAELVREANPLRIEGLMTMAAYGADPEATRPTFQELRQLRDQLQQQTGVMLPELSMGMSHDYPIAVEEGATLIRVGSNLFEGLEAE